MFTNAISKIALRPESRRPSNFNPALNRITFSNNSQIRALNCKNENASGGRNKFNNIGNPINPINICPNV